MTMSWEYAETDAEDGAVVNLSTAYLDAADEKDFSAGINALWHRVGWAISMRITKSTSLICPASTRSAIATARFWRRALDIHTIHTSWHLPNIMDMPNFNIYLGAYASWLDSSAAKSGNTDERYGARVRFKYFF